MGKETGQIILEKNQPVINYTRMLSYTVKTTWADRVLFIIVGILNQDKDLRVTEHINIDWLMQANSEEIFSYVQNLLKRKERYVYEEERLVLWVIFTNLDEKIIADLNQAGERIKNNTL